MRLRRWSPALVEAGGGLLLFALVLKLGLLAGVMQLDYYDAGVYRHYGEAITAGRVPYRDFHVEYPPGSLPFFIVPALLTRTATAYRRVFDVEMSIVFFILLFVTRVLAGRGASLVTALAVGLLGSVAVIRFDLGAALLTVVAILAVMRGRPGVSGIALGAAIAVKGYPAVLLPVIAVYLARLLGRRAALSACALAAAVVVVAYAPFVAVAPSGVRQSVDAQLARPLEIESSGGILYAIGHKLTRPPRRCCAYSFSGPPSTAVSAVSAVLGVASLLMIWLRFLRSSASERDLVFACAASVAVAIAFAKVFSPQYLLWLAPLVVVIPGRRRAALAGVLAACSLTAWVFPTHWQALLSLHWGPLLVELARNLLVVATAGLLATSVRPVRRLRGGP
jgi:hypothetical protein